jgi:hypothetical protein
MTETVVRGVQAHELDEFWFAVEPLLAKALKYCRGDHTAESVRQSLREKRMQLFVTWPKADAMGITAIEDRPGKRVLVIFAFAGLLPHDWRQILGNVTQWAKDQGCMAIELQGRRGWRRLLPDWQPVNLLRQEI